MPDPIASIIAAIDWKFVTDAVLKLLIAGAGFFIGWTQLRLQKEKLRMDLYDRRTEVLRVASELQYIDDYWEPEDETLDDMTNRWDNAIGQLSRNEISVRYLFKSDVGKIHDRLTLTTWKLYKSTLQDRVAKEKENQTRETEPSKEVLELRGKLEIEITELLVACKPYLDLSHLNNR